MKKTKDAVEVLEAVISDQTVYVVPEPVNISDFYDRKLCKEDIMDILNALGGEGEIIILDKDEKLDDVRVIVQGAPDEGLPYQTGTDWEV